MPAARMSERDESWPMTQDEAEDLRKWLKDSKKTIHTWSYFN